MSRSDTHGLDTLAEGSQYASEQLRLSRQQGANSNAPTDAGGIPLNAPEAIYSQDIHAHNQKKTGQSDGKQDLHQYDALADARSTIRKTSSANAVRRRISRACDQCNQLRTKCDGQQPCAHCHGNFILFIYSYST